MPHRPKVEDDEHEDVRPLDGAQLQLVLALMHKRYKLLAWFLTATGLRASEVIGLEVRHLQLDGDSPHVKVRQRVRRGNVGPIKSKHARRDIPIDAELVAALRSLTRGRARKQPVFQSTAGTRLQLDNVRNRYLRPAGEEAGCPWVGWHTFRHTCASKMFARGDNLVAVSEVPGPPLPELHAGHLRPPVRVGPGGAGERSVHQRRDGGARVGTRYCRRHIGARQSDVPSSAATPERGSRSSNDHEARRRRRH